MRKLTYFIVLTFLFTLLASCVVRTRGRGHARRGGCPSGYYWDDGRCHKPRKHKNKHGDHRGDGGDVKVRDHRR